MVGNALTKSARFMRAFTMPLNTLFLVHSFRHTHDSGGNANMAIIINVRGLDRMNSINEFDILYKSICRIDGIVNLHYY